MLRHACGVALANRGHDTRALQACLGHTNIQHDCGTPSCRRIGSRTSGGNANHMFKKNTPLQWVSFFIVLAMVVVLFWLAHYLERASF